MVNYLLNNNIGVTYVNNNANSSFEDLNSDIDLTRIHKNLQKF